METENAHIVHEEWKKSPHGVKEKNKVEDGQDAGKFIGVEYEGDFNSVTLKQI